MMDWAKLPRVEGELSFIGQEVSGIAEFFKAPESPPDHLPYETHRVPIHDLTGAVDELRLDREGFIVASFDDGAPDYDDRGQLETVWLPRVQALLKRETGAAHVFSWAMGRRFSPRLPQSRQTAVSTAAVMVHCDFSPGPIGLTIDNRTPDQVIAGIVGDARPRRWQAFNVWQPTSPPPHDRPLALCDASSIGGAELCSAQGRSTYESGLTVEFELSWAKYAPHQRWGYVRDLRPGQALIFSGLDMRAGETAGRVPHAAFVQDGVPADAPPRESVEVRNIAIWDD